MTYRRPGALGVTRVTLTRRRRRVLLALLTGATNLHGWRLCTTAQIWSGNLYPFLDHLEQAGWISAEMRTMSAGTMRRCYNLTEAGQDKAASLLGLRL